MKSQKVILLLIILLFSSNSSKKILMLAEDDSLIIQTSFEDDDFSMFTPRGDDDTSVLVIKDNGGKTGDKYHAITERSESWNSAQYDLEKTCEPEGEYLVSAALRTEWYCNICLAIYR